MQNKQRSKLVIIVMGLLILLLLGSFIWWLKPDNTATNTAALNADGTPTDASTAAAGETVLPGTAGVAGKANGNSPFVTGLENMPRSLQDTDVDGEIIIDENKNLVVTEGLRRLFDYFLSAMGEEDEATIVQRVEAYIRSHTPEPAASSAIEIFAQYREYLKALDGLQSSYGNLQMQATQAGEVDLSLIEQRRQDMIRLRKQIFTPETIEAFFAGEDAYEDYSMAMVRIEQDSSLSEAQKQASRADYISRLPDGVIKQNFEQQANFGELMQRTEELKAKGASPEALYAMRRQIVGEAAATRLAEVDKQENDFDARFNDYQAKRQALIAQAGSEAKAQAQITELERSQFDELERKRLTGYAQLKEQSQAKTP